MTTSYPAWGGDADTVRVVACALGSVIAKLKDVTDEIRREIEGAADV